MLPKSVCVCVGGGVVSILTCNNLFSCSLCQRRKLLYFGGWEYPANRGMVLVEMWFGVVIRNDVGLVRFVPKMAILGPTQREMKPPDLLLLFGGQSFVLWCHGVADVC